MESNEAKEVRKNEIMCSAAKRALIYLESDNLCDSNVAEAVRILEAAFAEIELIK